MLIDYDSFVFITGIILHSTSSISQLNHHSIHSSTITLSPIPLPATFIPCYNHRWNLCTTGFPPSPHSWSKGAAEKKKLEFAEILISFSSFIDCMTYLLLTMQDLWSQHLFVASVREDKCPFLCHWTKFKRQTTKQILIAKDHSIFLFLILAILSPRPQEEREVSH